MMFNLKDWLVIILAFMWLLVKKGFSGVQTIIKNHFKKDQTSKQKETELGKFNAPYMVDFNGKSVPALAGKQIEVKSRGIRKVIMVRREK